MEPYQLADRAAAQLNRAALRRTKQTKQRLLALGFDELNVMKETDALYEALDGMTRQKCRKLFLDRFFEVWAWLGDIAPQRDGKRKRIATAPMGPRNDREDVARPSSVPSGHLPPLGEGFAGDRKGRPYKGDGEDEVEELLEMHLAGLLDDVNPITHYSYASEVLRKRDRAKEAILSVPTKAQKQLEMEKHLRYFLQMAGWYLDFISQDAEIAAFTEADVEQVTRHEKMDEKTCSLCRKADGEVYDLDKIPELDHLRCRRWFTPKE